MYFNKLALKDFGKFNNNEIDLKPGVNLICVDNDSKKLALKEFVVGMFYGIKRSKGIEKNDDNYERIKSASGRNSSGKIYIKKDDKTYFVERDFQKKSSKVNALDVQTGREVILKKSNNLQETFFDTDRSTYVNGLCIAKPRAESSKELARDIKEYVGNMTLCGSVDIDKNKLVETLKEEKRNYDTRSLEREVEGIKEQMKRYDGVDDRLKTIREKIKGVEEEFAIETARRKREARKLVETEKGTGYEENNALSDNLDELAHNSVFSEEEKEKQEDKITDKLWFILLTGLFVIAVITAMVYILPFENGVRQLFVVCTTLFVIVTIVEGLYTKGVFEGEVTTPSEEDFKRVIQELEQQKAEEDVSIDMSFAEDFMERKTELKAEEHDLLEDKRRLQELEDELNVVETNLQTMQKELHAINYAINTINDISTELQADMKKLLTHTGEYISPLTNGKYDNVHFEIGGRVAVGKNGRYENLESLTYRDLKKVYMSVRLSVAKALNTDNLPIIIEAWDKDDDISMKDVSQCIAKLPSEQVILLTSSADVNKQLEAAGIEYNYITA